MGMSSLEQKFYIIWNEFAPDMKLQCQFKDERIRGKARCLLFDFHIIGTNILFEIQGGTGYNSSISAHKTASGMQRDCRKINKAQILGYVCLALTTGMVSKVYIKEVIRDVRNILKTQLQ